MSTVIKVCIAVIACSIAVAIISIVIPYWEVDGGLWTQDFAECPAYKVKGWLIAVRAIMISGTVTLGISCVLAFAFSLEQTIRTTANLCIISLLAGGILLLSGIIVFARNTPDTEYGPAFYLPVPAAVVAMFTALAVHKAKGPLRTDNPNHNSVI